MIIGIIVNIIIFCPNQAEGRAIDDYSDEEEDQLPSYRPVYTSKVADDDDPQLKSPHY